MAVDHGPDVIHLIRNTFRLASRRDWDALKHDVKPIYTAVNAAAARAALEELSEKWGNKYGAIIRLWNNAWEEFIPFLDYGGCRRIASGSVSRELHDDVPRVAHRRMGSHEERPIEMSAGFGEPNRGALQPMAPRVFDGDPIRLLGSPGGSS